MLAVRPGRAGAVRTAARDGADAVLSIAQYGSTRSINAGAAAAIAMHAWVRRRRFGQSLLRDQENGEPLCQGEPMSERVVVVGGDAGGMSAASQALRTAEKRGRTLDIVVLERGHWTSYSACGIPYWAAGTVDGPDELVARTPEEHRKRGIDVRMRTEAVRIDLGRRSVDSSTGERQRGTVEFDQLVRRDRCRTDPAGRSRHRQQRHPRRADTRRRRGLARLAAPDDPKRAVIVGAGYIGIEMAEAMVQRGLDVTVIDKAVEPMPTLDPELGRQVHEAMEAMGIEVETGTPVEGFEPGTTVRSGRWSRADETFPPTSWYSASASSRRPHSRKMPGCRSVITVVSGSTTGCGSRDTTVSGPPATASSPSTGSRERPCMFHWGRTPTSRGGSLGTNLGGGDATFPGVVRTAISKVCDLEVARTGMRRKTLTRAGLDYVTATTESTTRAGYFPGAEPITVKVLAEKPQAEGCSGRRSSAWRGRPNGSTSLAVALWTELTVGSLLRLDLSYAPPFSPVWDPVLIAARKAADLVNESSVNSGSPAANSPVSRMSDNASAEASSATTGHTRDRPPASIRRVPRDDTRTGRNLGSLGHEQLEPLSGQLHRVDSEVNEHSCAVRCLHDKCVRMQFDDLPAIGDTATTRLTARPGRSPHPGRRDRREDRSGTPAGVARPTGARTRTIGRGHIRSSISEAMVSACGPTTTCTTCRTAAHRTHPRPSGQARR